MSRAKKDLAFTERLVGLVQPGENDSDFARRCNVPQSYVWRWLHDGAIPQPEYCARIAAANHISTHWLITGEEQQGRFIAEPDPSNSVPPAYRQALSDCIALLQLDHPDRDRLVDQVSLLIEHSGAKRTPPKREMPAETPAEKPVEKPDLQIFINGGLALPDNDLEAAMIHFRRKLAQSQNKRKAREAKKGVSS